MFLWWCFCGGVLVVVFLCWCGGVFLVVFLWWCFCGGVFVVVFLRWCLVVVFLWWCSCRCVCVLVFVWWCFCGGVFVLVFLWGTGISCDPTPGSAATLPMPGVSCDPTHKNSMEGSTFFTFIKGQLRPYLTSVYRILQVFALFRGHSGSSTAFLLSIFPPPPLATHALRPYLATFLLSNFPPLGNPCFQWLKFKYNVPFIKFFTPPWQPMLCDPTWQHSFYQIFPPLALSMIQVQVQHSFYQFFPPLGNPCFATLTDNIPFIKIPPPPPWANHALRPYLTTFLLSNFPPPWQPMLSMIQVQVQHSFYQKFPPLGKPCFATLPDNIPFIKFSPPLATHAFNDSTSSTTFLLSKFRPPHTPPLATRALRPYLTTFLLSNVPPPWQPMLCDPTWQHSPPLGNPCFQWFKFKYNIPFIKFFPPLGNPCFATLPDNVPFIKFPPPWQPMLSMIEVQVQHSFYQNFPPFLGKPCFATLPDNIPFIKFSPPWQPMLSMIQVQVQHSFYQNFPPPPPWQTMLCDPTWQHSFYQIFPPLATHAFNDSSSSTTFPLSKFRPPPLGDPCALRPYLTTFFLSNFPPPWQPMLCDPTWQHSPPSLTHAFNDSSSSTTFLLSKIFPPLGKPCFATLPDNIPFINFFPPLATHAFNDSSSSTTFLLSKFPPPLATHALRPYLTTFLLSNFPAPWQPMLSMIQLQVQHSFYQNFPPLGNPCLATDNIPFIKFCFITCLP